MRALERHERALQKALWRPPSPRGATNTGLALQPPLEPLEQPPKPPATSRPPRLSGAAGPPMPSSSWSSPVLTPRGASRRRCTGLAPGDVPGAGHVPLAPGRGGDEFNPEQVPVTESLASAPGGHPGTSPPGAFGTSPPGAQENIPEPVRGVEAPGLPVRPPWASEDSRGPPIPAFAGDTGSRTCTRVPYRYRKRRESHLLGNSPIRRCR